MIIPDHVIEAAANSDAEFDGRSLQAMPRADRERYLERSKACIQAALASLWQPIESAPDRTRLITYRSGEKWMNMCVRMPDGEWIEDGGRTTVTHHSFAAPTHFIDPSIFPLPQSMEEEG